MVFCDLSTPRVEGRGFSVYNDVKAKLVALGVPAAEVQFMQDHDSDAAKVFEHEERYRELVKRQGELVEALDITKNQASSQLDTAEGETETPVESVEVDQSTAAEVRVAI